MKSVARALTVLVCLTSVPASSSGGFTGSDPPYTHITSSSVTVDSNGRVRYELGGAAGVGRQQEHFEGSCSYDPKTRRAAESLTNAAGNSILTTSDCDRDPWETGVPCSGGQISVKGFNANATNWIEGLKVNVPISAVSLSSADRASLVLAKRKAEEQARLKTVQNRVIEPTPTPTPKNVHLAAGAAARLPESLPTAAPTRPVPPPAAPLYGAVYTGGNPPVGIKVGHVVTVPVTVQNTGAQTWPAGGAFHLSYHWYSGAAEIVKDGDRTAMPSAVPPGGSVNLSAKVTAPPRAGDAALKWDMIQDGVGWFSDKGVPMSPPRNTSIKP